MISIDSILIIFLHYQGRKSRVLLEKLIKKILVMEVKRTWISRVWDVLLWVLMLVCLGLFGTM